MRENHAEKADLGSRWSRLAACCVAMLAVANLQYGWTLFTTPLMADLRVSLAAVQWAFTFFVLAQTWLFPVTGHLIDRFGPRRIVTISSVLVGTGWIGSGLTHSLAGLYISYAIGGLGASAVYGACISMAMKWFPDRRGLCVGLVAGCFGAGFGLTVLPIQHSLAATGYRSTFLTWGLIQGFVVLVAAQFMRAPSPNWVAPAQKQSTSSKPSLVQQSSRDFTPREMLSTAPFYLLYVMMTLVAFGGLMVTAQISPIGMAYGFHQQVLARGVTVLSVALMFQQVLNGFARVLWGWISDYLGRYYTMGLAFFLEAFAILGLVQWVDRPLFFVIFSSLTFLAWGQIYSLFPAVVADVFGTKHSTANYGIQYTSKGVASILAGPGAAALTALASSWMPVLWMAAVCDFTAALLALFWLKPLVTRLIRQSTNASSHPELSANAHSPALVKGPHESVEVPNVDLG